MNLPCYGFRIVERQGRAHSKRHESYDIEDDRFEGYTQQTTPGMIQAIRDALDDMMKLTQQLAKGAWPDHLFLKYFNAGDEDKVRRMIAYVSGLITDSYGGFRADMLYVQQRPFNEDGDDIACMRAATDPSVIGETKLALMTLDSSFFALPTLKEISCHDLGDKLTDEWKSRGGILLHEMMHWPTATNSHIILKERIMDWEPPSDALLTGIPPPGAPDVVTDAYGAFNNVYLRNAGGDPLLNADTYLYFAYEWYYGMRCLKKVAYHEGQKDGFFTRPSSHADGVQIFPATHGKAPKVPDFKRSRI